MVARTRTMNLCPLHYSSQENRSTLARMHEIHFHRRVLTARLLRGHHKAIRLQGLEAGSIASIHQQGGSDLLRQLRSGSVDPAV